MKADYDTVTSDVRDDETGAQTRSAVAGVEVPQSRTGVFESPSQIFAISSTVTSQILLAVCRPLRLGFSTSHYRQLQSTSRISLRKNSTMSESEAGSSSITVPEGFTLHTENTSHILISSKEEAFLNPVQEFNRDLSVACIRVWSEEFNREKEAKWKQAQERRAKRDADTKAGQRKEVKKARSEHLVIQHLIY